MLGLLLNVPYYLFGFPTHDFAINKKDAYPARNILYTHKSTHTMAGCNQEEEEEEKGEKFENDGCRGGGGHARGEAVGPYYRVGEKEIRLHH